MNLQRLLERARDKRNFDSLASYVEFGLQFLAYIHGERNLQAVIVSKNEQRYRFFQYKEDGHFNITRPINSELMLTARAPRRLKRDFLYAIDNARTLTRKNHEQRQIICQGIYTIQQAIGATLDALPSGHSNTARKINGDLFERLIRLLVVRLGVECVSGTVKVPVIFNGVEQFRMSYQHDLIIADGDVKLIGGVKTSSKDRLDKIFMDKFLYCRLTETVIPHIAIFLNDVQRKNMANPKGYGINSTFLPGHFKAYTVKLNPLDGVYYCDIRPSMRSDPILATHIRSIDHFFCKDIWTFLAKPGDSRAEVDPSTVHAAAGGRGRRRRSTFSQVRSGTRRPK